jgi:hypothetical protein
VLEQVETGELPAPQDADESCVSMPCDVRPGKKRSSLDGVSPIERASVGARGVKIGKESY